MTSREFSNHISQADFGSAVVSMRNRSGLGASILGRAGLAVARVLLAFSALSIVSAHAQDDDEEDAKTVEDRVEDLEKIDGLFPVYRDPENGDVFLEISEDQLDQEFIAFTYIENGVLEAGFFKGAYGDQQILSPRRYFDRIEFVEKSTSFYFDPERPAREGS